MGISTETQQGVWLGPEITTPETLIVPAEKSALVTVDLDAVRDAVPEHVIFTEGNTVLSTRSRYAQLGGEVPNHASIVFSQTFNHPESPPIALLPFTNYSKAPLELVEGDVCRLMRREGPPLSGAVLLDPIANGKIIMGGEEGRDWWIAENPKGSPIGVGLYIKEPETWLPPRNEAIRPSGGTTISFRDEMKQYFRPIKPGDQPLIRISETNEFMLTTPDIIGFFQQDIVAVPRPDTWIVNGLQINAPALYPAYPARGWRLRTELKNTPAELRPNNVLPSRRKAIVATFFSVLNPSG